MLYRFDRCCELPNRHLGHGTAEPPCSEACRGGTGHRGGLQGCGGATAAHGGRDRGQPAALVHADHAAGRPSRHNPGRCLPVRHHALRARPGRRCAHLQHAHGCAPAVALCSMLFIHYGGSSLASPHRSTSGQCQPPASTARVGHAGQAPNHLLECGADVYAAVAQA